jgi:hypothetical protein
MIELLIYIKSPISGQQIPLSTFVKFDTQHVSFLSINPVSGPRE